MLKQTRAVLRQGRAFILGIGVMGVLCAILIADGYPGVPGSSFVDLRRPLDIDGTEGQFPAFDLAGTGWQSINFTGRTGTAGDTWITLLGASNTTSDATVSADILIRQFDNRKGAGPLVLFNEAVGKKGLALTIFDNGNTDTLVLSTVDQAGKLAPLKTVALGGGILENVWYQATMHVDVGGGLVAIEGKVFQHVNPADPSSALGSQVGATLIESGGLPAGVDEAGTVGILAAAINAFVDTSVTSFTVVP